MGKWDVKLDIRFSYQHTLLVEADTEDDAWAKAVTLANRCSQEVDSVDVNVDMLCTDDVDIVDVKAAKGENDGV